MPTEYPAIIDDITDKSYSCLVLVNNVELKLQFPKGIMEHYDLKKGDRFYWKPSKDGDISAENIRPGERLEDSINEEWLPLAEDLKD